MPLYTRTFDVTPGSSNLSGPVEDEFELIEQAFSQVESDRTTDLADLAAALALKAPIASPALTGTPTAPTPPLGDTSTRLATMGALSAAIGASGAVPPQSGHAGEFLKTDGWSASWAPVTSGVAWADVTGKPTTLAGFGITNGQHAIEITAGAGVVSIAPARIAFEGMTVRRKGDGVSVAPIFPHHLLLAQGIL